MWKVQVIGILSSIMLIASGGNPAFAVVKGEVDGRWSVRRIACNGQKANEGVKSLYTGGNYISVLIDGDSGAFVDYVNKCKLNMPLSFSYTDEYLIGTFTGIITCSAHMSAPDACATQPLCGKPLPVTVAYEARLLNPGTLYWKSTDVTFDINCTNYGMENPIEYLMKR